MSEYSTQGVARVGVQTNRSILELVPTMMELQKCDLTTTSANSSLDYKVYFNIRAICATVELVEMPFSSCGRL